MEEEGLIVKIQDGNYWGIDASNDEFAWPDLNVWNDNNKKIDSPIYNDRFLMNQNVNTFVQYYKWVQSRFSKKQVVLLYFINNNFTESSYILKGDHKFSFIGYECVYLSNEYGEPVLFSPMYNEKIKTSITHLNEYDLIYSIDEALVYKKFRESVIGHSEYNIETAYNELNLQVVQVFKFEE